MPRNNVVTYWFSEEERLAIIQKYGPPLPPEQAEQIRRKYRLSAGWKGEKDAKKRSAGSQGI